MNLAKQVKKQYRQKVQHTGFALPTVLIISIALLAIGVSTLQIGAAVSRSLADQHWNRLAKLTAQSGVAFVSSCLSNGIATWPPLAPNHTCDGTVIPSASAYISSDTSAAASPGRWRSTYTISTPVAGSDNHPRINITGKVETLSPGGSVVKTYTWNYNGVTGSNNDGAAAPTAKKPVKIKQGDYQGCAVTTDQLAYCAGFNDYGQLGEGASGPARPTPVAFTIPGNKPITDITTTINFYSCALTADQEVWCAGANGNGQLGVGSTATQTAPAMFQLGVKKAAQVMANYYYFNTCALTTDQLVYCAGINDYGQTGDGVATTTNRTTPVQFGPALGKKIVSMSSNFYNTCAVTADQLGYCTGFNHVGQLAQGGADTTTRYAPVVFTPTTGSVVSMSVGAFHVCALTTNQKVYCSGYNAYGQLGNGTTTSSTSPVEFNLAGKKAASVVASLHHTCVLTTDELVYCSGYNLYGQLGDGTKPADQATPVPFNLSGKKAASISSQYFHTCVLTTDQLVYCAGYNPFGALGDGTTTDQTNPVQFSLGGKKSTSISTSSYQSCAITTIQEIHCAGYNPYGNLGNNNPVTSQTVPVKFILP